METVIIKYNAGNIRSVQYAIERLGLKANVTDDHRLIKKADKVIFPGVGEASSTMSFLKTKGLDDVLRNLTQPVLGICLGQQLLCEKSEEGNVTSIGVYNVPVIKFQPVLKVPHMGWNKLYDMKGELFKGIDRDSYVYFVHSYYVPLCEYTSATCDYILPFSAALQRDNFYSTQFHPEKSGDVGNLILKNFIEL